MEWLRGVSVIGFDTNGDPAPNGMRRRETSINHLEIAESERWIVGVRPVEEHGLKFPLP